MNSTIDQTIYKDGIKVFKELVEINPDDKDWNYYLGICYYKLQRFTEAEKYLDIASEDMSYKLKILYLKEINDTRSVKL
jgi:tetratricopeptide (TPR) repeat protein